SLFEFQNCIIPNLGEDPGDDCLVFNDDFISGEFDHEIAGKATKLAIPQGIAAFAPADAGIRNGEPGLDDEILVVNTGNNTLLEFGAGASGDARPNTIIQGGLTGMNQPVGLAIRPPDAPLDQCDATFNRPGTCPDL